MMAIGEDTERGLGELSVRLEIAPAALAGAVDDRLAAWASADLVTRLWARDPSLWAPAGPGAGGWPPELTDRLGWLDLPEGALERAPELSALADEVRREGYERVVLLGMGGSSLAPEVFQAVLGGGAGFPVLTLLDSTHPDAVLAVEADLDLARTLFVVASKSGTTVETISLFRYFWHRVAETVPEPGRSFVAITDPSTPLAELAAERRFRRVVLAPPDVGGRYSALSPFGMLPAALVGLDGARIASGAAELAQRLREPGPGNPGLPLAAALAEAEIAGRDKLTFLAAPPLDALPIWIEQLVAESTGKGGRGLVPVVGEPMREPGGYGPDHLFVHMTLAGEAPGALDETVERLAAAGHPVVRIAAPGPWSLGAAMLLWEWAVAAAGSAMGIQPFDQPDVELAKRRAKEAMAGGPARAAGKVEEVSADDPERLREAVSSWWRRGGGEGSRRRYLAIQSFLPPGAEVDHALRKIRVAAADHLGIATTAGYGPRFLHSTGQLHKGGPASGLFLQVIDTPKGDLAIPGSEHGFGDLVRAQAVGDYRALRERGRSVLRVRLGSDRVTGLAHLASAFEASG